MLTCPFQFNISNTLPDTVLEQVSVIMQPSEGSGLTEDFIIPLPSLTSANSPGVVYVSFTRDDPSDYAVGAFACTLKFISKEVDPASGQPEEEGYDDEYQVEELDLSAGDVSAGTKQSWPSKLTANTFPSTSRRATPPSAASGSAWAARRLRPRPLRSALRKASRLRAIRSSRVRPPPIESKGDG